MAIEPSIESDLGMQFTIRSLYLACHGLMLSSNKLSTVKQVIKKSTLFAYFCDPEK